MIDRDSMILVPHVSPTLRASARNREKVSRALDRERKRKGGLARKIQAARNINRGRKAAAALRGLAGRSATARAASGAARAAVGNPVGVAIAATIVVGIAFLRLSTDQPFEGMGEELNQMFLGDLDDEARAKMRVRRQFQENDELTRIAGQEGRANSQMLRVAKDLTDFYKVQEVGASQLRREFPVNNNFDILILRARDAVYKALGKDGVSRWVQAFRIIKSLRCPVDIDGAIRRILT